MMAAVTDTEPTVAVSGRRLVGHQRDHRYFGRSLDPARQVPVRPSASTGGEDDDLVVVIDPKESADGPERVAGQDLAGQREAQITQGSHEPFEPGLGHVPLLVVDPYAIIPRSWAADGRVGPQLGSLESGDEYMQVARSSLASLFEQPEQAGVRRAVVGDQKAAMTIGGWGEIGERFLSEDQGDAPDLLGVLASIKRWRSVPPNGYVQTKIRPSRETIKAGAPDRDPQPT